MLFFDPTFLLLLPAILLATYASAKVKAAFAKYSRRRSSSGYTGAQVARAILQRNGLGDIPVEPVEGNLSDHYDPGKGVLKLSEPVYGSPSLAALGVAAHEAGHAVQHASGYLPMKIRQGIFPVAALGNNLGFILFFVGFLLLLLTPLPFGILIAKAGIVLFAAGTVFTFVTLPVEFNASRRALVALEAGGFVTSAERQDAKKVLDAAALTYVAAAFVAMMMLLRFVLLLAMAQGRR